MNKKLVAAAIAAAVAAPAAFAGDVTVYGKLHVSMDSVDAGNYDGFALASRASRLGFKGSEDLGNGLKAVWKMEFGTVLTEDRTQTVSFNDVDTTDGDGTATGGSTTVTRTANVNQLGAGLTQRDHYLGLAGNFGTVLIAGNMNSPYKNSTGKMDFFGDTLADYNNTLGFEDNRFDNVLVYMSPKFSGMQVAVAAIAGENNTTGNDGLADGYSMALTYNNAGLSAAIAYENTDDFQTADDHKWRVGLGYKMDALKVAAVYEDEKEATDSDRWQISAAYAMGNNTLKAMYGQQDSGTTDADAWAIGVDHKMSKRTKVYALYTDSEAGLRGESDGNYTGGGNGFSLGMIHSF